MLLLLIYNKKGADSHEPAPQSMKSNVKTKKNGYCNIMPDFRFLQLNLQIVLLFFSLL